MKLDDIVWLSYNDLTAKKVRTMLTVVMVVIGVASIVALVSLTAGISASISSALSSLGPTSIIMSSTSTTGFTLADIDGITSLPNVSTAIPILEGAGTLAANGQNSSVTIIGVSPENLQDLIGPVSLYQGTVYNDTVGPSSVVGHTVAFPSTGSGQSVMVGQPANLKVSSGRTTSTYTIPIVGILQSYGTTLISVDTAVFMSLSAAEELFHRLSFNTILVKANNASSVSSVDTTLTNIYGGKARILDTQALAATANSIVGGITVFLLLIAGISLLVAAIGIMNIMLMAVMERTHEIGIMKSLGFKSRDVLTIFLFQALMIGFVGGIIGIGLGAGASYSLAYLASHSSPSNSTTTAPASSGGSFRGGGGGTVFAGGGGGSSSSSSSTLSFSPVLTLGTIAEAMFVAIVVSALAGLYPAWKASKMEPIEALRQL